MDLSYLDREDYREIPLLRMVDNNNGNLPFYIRKYRLDGQSSRIHRHEYMQVNYICDGKGKHYINGHEFGIIKGDIFIIPPYIPHFIGTSEAGHIEVLEFEFEPGFIVQQSDTLEDAKAYFDFAYLEPFLVSENKVRPSLNLAGKLQIECEEMLQEAQKEYNARNKGFMLVIKSLILKLLVVVGRKFEEDMTGSDALQVFDRHRAAIFDALSYINEHYAEELTIEEVARKMNFSQSYFSYLFKSITLKTFTEHINSIRISRAMELLKNTDKRVIDIAVDVGFNNVNHFNRIFRQHTGNTPMFYRRTIVNVSKKSQNSQVSNQ